jgi:hypothetical protein
MLTHLLAALLALTDPPAASGASGASAAPATPPAAAADAGDPAAPTAELRFRLPRELESVGVPEQVLRALAKELAGKSWYKVESRFVCTPVVKGHPASALGWEWVARGDQKVISGLSDAIERWKRGLLASLNVDEPAEPRPFDIDFPGGTVRDYVAALRAASAGANINVQPEAQELVLPPIRLRGVNAATALEGLRVISAKDASGKQVSILLEVIHNVDPRNRMQVGNAAESSEPIYVLLRPTSPVKAPGVPLVYKFTPGSKMAEQVDQLPQAVMMACAAEGIGPSDLTFNVHPSGLLMVSGTKAALRVADAVVSVALGTEPRLADRPPSNAPAAPPANPR